MSVTTNKEVVNFNALPCCPEVETDGVCDIIDLRRRLVFPTRQRQVNGQPVRVEVIFHTRFTRCPGPLALGEIAYSTTLLPGEKVRLATTDRRSRFSVDSASNLSYRSEQISEEQYRMRALRAFMTDENVQDRGSDHYSEESKWDFHGDASGSIGFFSAGADTNARGSHSASSARDYLREHRAHAEMSDSQSVESTRKAHSVSIGEVSSRTHVQGESADHYEAASREFANPNHCHAVTFMFYRLNKTETIKFELLAIERRVLDPVALMPVAANPFRSTGAIATVPQDVPATSKTRLETLERSIQSENITRFQTGPGGVAGLNVLQATRSNTIARLALPEPGMEQPLPDELRAKALEEVDAQLTAQGLIDKETRKVSKDAQREIGYERKTSVPTAGIIVKSCMDECGICEPEVEQKLQLDLERMALENKLLARKIELLDKAQEYRCCPVAETE